MAAFLDRFHLGFHDIFRNLFNFENENPAVGENSKK
jgi:hypothetical protein